jgi:hypothetical protein
MRQIKHILDEESLGRQRRHEQFLDPFTSLFAHRDFLAGDRSSVPGYNHTHLG